MPTEDAVNEMKQQSHGTNTNTGPHRHSNTSQKDKDVILKQIYGPWKIYTLCMIEYSSLQAMFLNPTIPGLYQIYQKVGSD